MLPLVKPRAADDDDHHYNIIINIIINIVINIIDIKIIIMNIVINIIINMRGRRIGTHDGRSRRCQGAAVWPAKGLGRLSGAHFGTRFEALWEPFLDTFLEP